MHMCMWIYEPSRGAAAALLVVRASRVGRQQGQAPATLVLRCGRGRGRSARALRAVLCVWLLLRALRYLRGFLRLLVSR
jgi:hypothetical protein